MAPSLSQQADRRPQAAHRARCIRRWASGCSDAAGLPSESLRLRLAGSLAGRTEAPFEPEDTAAAVDGRALADYRESTGSDQVPVDLSTDGPAGPPRSSESRSESPREPEVRVASIFKVNRGGAPTSHQKQR